MIYLQQGDVLLFKTKFDQLNSKTLSKEIIHEGDQNNHILTGLFKYDQKTRRLEVLEKSKLHHNEHKNIELEPGFYEKKIVLEYDHFLEESREVID